MPKIMAPAGGGKCFYSAAISSAEDLIVPSPLHIRHTISQPKVCARTLVINENVEAHKNIVFSHSSVVGGLSQPSNALSDSRTHK